MRHLFIELLLIVLVSVSASVNLSAQAMDQFEPELFQKMSGLHTQGKWEEALVYAKQWSEKAEKKFGNEDSTYAFAMTYIGIISVKLELFEQAEKAYQSALRAREKVFGKKHRAYAGTLTNLAGLYLAMGQYDKAESLYRQGRDIIAETVGTDHPNYATTTTNLAYLYALFGRYELSEKLYNEAIAIHAKVHGKRSAQYLTALNNLALLYHDLKEYDTEVKLLEEVLDAASEVYGYDHPYYADYLNNLANLYIETKRFIEAEALYKQALEIYGETVGKKHSDYARSLNNLASLYLLTKRYEDAYPIQKQAVDVWEQKLGKKHPQLAVAYSNMALLSLHKNEKEKAQAYINAAFTANSDKEVHAPDMKSLFDSLQSTNFQSGPIAIYLCEQMLHMQNLMCKYGVCSKEEYLAAAERSLFLSDKLQQNFMTDEDRLQLLSSGLPLLAAHIHAALEVGSDFENLEKAFWSADQNKSTLLESALNGDANFGGLPDSVVQKEKLMKQQLDVMNKEFFEANEAAKKSEIQTKIANLNLEIESFKNYLKNKYPKYYAFRFKSEQNNMRSLQALLPEKTLLLEYFLEDTLAYVFVATNKKLEAFRQTLKKEELEKICKEFRDLVSNYDQSHDKLVAFTKVSYQMYQRLLETALKSNPQADALIIVADGLLGHVPFEAFLTTAVDNPEDYASLPYLLRKYKVSYSYSAKLWIENTSQAETKKEQTILAMAGSYQLKNNTGTKPTTRSGTLRTLREALQDLPAAKNEVETLASYFKGDFYTGLEANEAKFKEKALEHGVIHLAMHGIIDIKNPILSSIAFTENSDTVEDNFLQAFEISALKTQAKLVVLSACETGYGRFKQGEGVMSLARSFMYAGVPSMVVSLWQVNDQSTAIIMRSFYKNLSEGMDKAEALRQAKLFYLTHVHSEGAAHPSFWAPFVQLGDSRPLKIAAKTNYWFWGGIAAAALALFALIFMFKRKK